MDTTELENLKHLDGEIDKGISHIIVQLIEYEHNSVVSKSILKKTTGSINAMSFASGEGLDEKISPFDSFAQIIDGSAEITISKKTYVLRLGEGMIIPAHTPNIIKANQRFKMIITTIKSGYDA